jgi:hypothetical protein
MRRYDKNSVKKIVKDQVVRSATAIIRSIDMDRVNITLGNSSTLVRGVKVVGNAKKLAVGSSVPITWREGRPMVFQIAGEAIATPAVAGVASAAAQYQTSVFLDFTTAFVSSNYPLTRYTNASQYFGGLWRAFDAIDDYMEWSFPIDIGKYTMTLLGMKGNADGIVQVFLDGTYLNEIDQYGSATFNVTWDIPVTISRGGIHSLRFTEVGKNASATDYKIGGNYVTLCPIYS